MSMKRPVSFVMLIVIPLLLLLPLCSFTSASAATSPKTTRHKNKSCGWELMQNLHIPIASLGTLYAKQTGDRSLCTLQDDGSEYCTCIYECGNGVWTSTSTSTRITSLRKTRHNDEEKINDPKGDNDNDGDNGDNDVDVDAWTWEEGCNKYCHAGVCDGQI